MLAAYQAFDSIPLRWRFEFAREKFLSVKTLQTIGGLKRQLLELLSGAGFVASGLRAARVEGIGRRGDGSDGCRLALLQAEAASASTSAASASAAASAYGAGANIGVNGGGIVVVGDWSCPRCNALVFASKKNCFKCHCPRPTPPPPPAPGNDNNNGGDNNGGDHEDGGETIVLKRELEKQLKQLEEKQRQEQEQQQLQQQQQQQQQQLQQQQLQQQQLQQQQHQQQFWQPYQQDQMGGRSGCDEGIFGGEMKNAPLLKSLLVAALFPQACSLKMRLKRKNK
jgi:hypothetical protein